METKVLHSHYNHEEQINTPIKKIKKKNNKSRENKNKKETLHDSFPIAYSCNYVSAEPMIRSAWTGSFNLWYNNESSRIIHGFSACLSTKACLKVWNEATQLQEIVQFEVLKKACVWPESFKRSLSGPRDQNIALYFFPSLMKNESVYDQLVFEMMNDDLAMRAFVQNAELLVFTSVELPQQFWRFQARFYLLGSF